MGMFARHRRNRQIPALNTASLPDLIFTMLFFFMLVTNMRESSPQNPLDLPAGEHLEEAQDDANLHYIYIGVTKEGDNYMQLDEKTMSLPELERNLPALAHGESRPAVALGIDGKVEMSRVEKVKQVLRKLNIPVIYYLGDERNNTR